MFSYSYIHSYDLFEKARLKLSPLIQNNVQQYYLLEYVRYLPSYQKCQKIVALSPLPLRNIMGNLGDGGKSYPTGKNLLIFPSEKFPSIDLNLSLSEVSFLPHQITIFNSLPYATFICSCSHFCRIRF